MGASTLVAACLTMAVAVSWRQRMSDDHVAVSGLRVWAGSVLACLHCLAAAEFMRS